VVPGRYFPDLYGKAIMTKIVLVKGARISIELVARQLHDDPLWHCCVCYVVRREEGGGGEPCFLQ